MIKGEILKKTAAACIFSGIMAAFLTACSGKETKGTNTSENKKIEEVSNQTKKRDKGNVESKEKIVDNFQAEYYDFKTDLEYMSDFCYDNDRVYMVGYKSSEEGATTWCFLSCKTDGSDIQESDILLEENEYYSGGFCIDKKGQIRFITNSYSEEDGNRFFVKILDKEGKDLESYQISAQEEDGCYNFVAKNPHACVWDESHFIP